MYRRFFPFIAVTIFFLIAAGGTVFALTRGEDQQPAPTPLSVAPAPASNGAASVPGLMNFQGRLADFQGRPINSAVEVTFRIYDAATGDSPLWEEVQNVVAENGLFTVLLGSSVPLTPALFANGSERWLAMQATGDREMSPRLRVASVPYALVAAQARTSATLNGLSASDFTTTGDLGGHVVDQEAHHTRYSDTEAVAAMGVNTGDNPLHHDRYVDSEAVSAVLAADGPDSGLDADTVDGVGSSGFALADLGNNEAIAVLCRLEVQIWEGAKNFQLSPHCLGLLPATLTTVDSTGDVGLYTSIAIGQGGLPVISYFTAHARLRVVRCNDPACTSATLASLDSAGEVGQYTSSSIAIGQDGLPVISYYDRTNRDLKVAHCDDAACASTTLHSTGDVGWYTSIGIGKDGLPVISYFDATNLDLKVAHCNNTACTGATLATLDSAGRVGEYTSIAIGQDGLPVISYYDSTTGDLKVARCNNTACTRP